MIKITVGPGLRLVSSMASYISKTYSSSNPHTRDIEGDVMFDLNSQCFKIYDGATWQSYNSQQGQIELDGDTQSLLAWARKKRNEEMELESLAEINPTIKDLVQQVKEKQNQIKMVQTLINSPGDEGNPSF